MMEDLAVLNPHADLDVLTSAGESAFEDQPAMFTEALLDWLATPQRASSRRSRKSTRRWMRRDGNRRR